jgi:flavin reductase (DIM6/NTAB) family NADH-FMN oxidoreductase RutF
VSEDELRQIMDHMPYGLYVIGSKMQEGVNGMMADWVMQVSFKPRLLTISLEHDAHTLANIKANSFFTVNLLAEGDDGMRLAGHFAQPYYGSKVHGPQAEGVHRKLEGIDYRLTARGCPVLHAAMAWLECAASEFVVAGDHTLVIGEVLDGSVLREGEPLTSTFTGWNYSG